MPDIPAVERLEDRFDSLVLLGEMPSWARALAGRWPTGRVGRRPLVLASDPATLAQLVAAAGAFNAYVGAQAQGALAAACDVVLAAPADEGALLAAARAARAALHVPKTLNILVLYNDAYTHIESTREHLRALADHSRHRYFFMPAQETVDSAGPGRRFEDYRGDWPAAWDFDLFDAVVWHFVLPAYKSPEHWPSDYIARTVLDRLARYDGLKVLFVQDEYDHTEMTWRSIREAGVNLVMTVIPEPHPRLAYPEAQLPGVEVISTLTGFVPADIDRLAAFALPMDQRQVRIAYRGRVLPHRFGDLGREKYVIGARMRALAQARGVPVDIDWTEDSRIYGEGWYRFLGSARATLITESGANIFDFDGALARAEAEAGDLDYETFAARHLVGRQDEIRQNQVSPKVFEAIALRTALVGFEGDYSGVIRPHEHFIPLRKDFANADDVFAQLEDSAALEAMTERAWRDVIASGLYDYPTFVRRFDAIVEGRVTGPARSEIIASPILVRRAGQADFEPLVRAHPFEHVLNTGVLYGGFQRRRLEDAMGRVREAESVLERTQRIPPPADATTVFAVGPEGVRCYDFWRNAGATLTMTEAGAAITTPPVAWHYAAGVPLDFSTVRFGETHCWVRLDVRDVTGPLLVAIYGAEDDSLWFETTVPEGPRPQSVFLMISEPRGDLLLLRTGARDVAAATTILGAAILTASVYAPEVLALARRLGGGEG